jgi:hypothetical protein
VSVGRASAAGRISGPGQAAPPGTVQMCRSAAPDRRHSVAGTNANGRPAASCLLTLAHPASSDVHLHFGRVEVPGRSLTDRASVTVMSWR